MSDILNSLLFGGQAKKRKAFFSFHYADIFRVNVVRKSGEFQQGTSTTGREVSGFYDQSLWEKAKSESPEALKNLIRNGVDGTSVVCVLTGTQTWQRRWVRYEIARSVIDGKGLVAVHINSITHHKDGVAHDRGDNPCKYLGIFESDGGGYYLCERKNIKNTWTWVLYEDYKQSVSLPKYMKPPAKGTVIRLSEVTREYDWSQNGASNVGGWLDMAAQDAGK